MYKEFIVEWIDWDYKTHKTKYTPNLHTFYGWDNKAQLRKRDREKCREILQRWQI